MLSVLSPRNLFRAAIDVELSSAAALAAAAHSEEARLRWIEHWNRLHAFRLFQYADVTLGADRGSELAALVRSAYELDPFDRAWAIEGAAYWWAHRRSPEEIGRSFARMRLPVSSVIPVHSGVGLSVATRLLPDIAAVIDACLAFSAPGFEQVAIEASGLATRNLSPHHVPAIDERIAASDPSVRACFWHGVGRGTYFAPSSWTPEAGSASLDRLWSLVPDDFAADSAVSGFAWAATLVNVLAPAVLERYGGGLSDARDQRTFARGVRAALLAWQHMAPDDDAIHAWLDATRGELVARPARAAFEAFPSLRRDGRVGDALFGGNR